MASQPKLEEVIRAPPPRQAESSDSSIGGSRQREARHESLRDSGAESPGRQHSRRSKKRSLRHSPDRAHTSWELQGRSSSRDRVTSGGRHKQKASSKKRRRRSPSPSEERHGSVEMNGRNALTYKKQQRSPESSDDENDSDERQRQDYTKSKKAKKKGHRSSRHEHGRRRSDHTYVLYSLFLFFWLLTDEVISPRSIAAQLHSKLCTPALELRVLRLLNGWQRMEHAGPRRGAQGTYGGLKRESREPGTQSTGARLSTKAGMIGALQMSRRWSIVGLSRSKQGVPCLPMMSPMRCGRGLRPCLPSLQL